MIDSHCHLAAPQFADELPDVLSRARAKGVSTMICIGDSLEESEDGVQLAEKYEYIFCTVGVHPHNAKHWKEGDASVLRSLVQSSPKVRGIGEIGLDYHYDFSPREDQKRVFRAQLQLAKDLAVPAVLHNRESIDDLRKIIGEIDPPSLVLHCCTEKFEDVAPLLERGYLLSFTGIATYPNAAIIRETIQQCTLDQMMIETDAPFLAPIPHRGKRNEPAFVVGVAKAIAEIKGIDFEEVDRVTTENAKRFFGLP